VASWCPRPPERRYQLRRLRLPSGEVTALGAIAPALLLTIPKAPACFPCAGAFSVPALADLHLGLGVSLVLPLSAARLPGGLKGRLGLRRRLVNGRLGDLRTPGCPLGILPGQLVHLGAEVTDVLPEPGQGLAAVLAARGCGLGLRLALGAVLLDLGIGDRGEPCHLLGLRGRPQRPAPPPRR
jgi:hypothetical protein